MFQRFKTNTRRRQILQESPSHYVRTPTPRSRSKSRELLGRTPTKLYSPFGIESPQHRKMDTKFVQQVGANDDKKNNPKHKKKKNDIWNKENCLEERETEINNWNFLNRNSQSLLK